AWRLDENAPERCFAYGGDADNLYSTTITVTETNPAWSASGKDSANAPTVLLGVGARALGTVLNVEAADTILKERTGRTDSVFTISLLLSWSFNLFHQHAEAVPTTP